MIEVVFHGELGVDNHAKDSHGVMIIQLLFGEKQLWLMHGKTAEFTAFARDEVAFTCRQIEHLRRFIY